MFFGSKLDMPDVSLHYREWTHQFALAANWILFANIDSKLYGD